MKAIGKAFYKCGLRIWDDSRGTAEGVFLSVTGRNSVVDLLQLDTPLKRVVGSMPIAGLQIPLTPMRTSKPVPREHRLISAFMQFRSKSKPVSCSESKPRYRRRSL